ncbi:Insect cuticle protein [Trinorchestia longiramus]|nr:Insect cuticle protein [Trinorchestia longiramus]
MVAKVLVSFLLVLSPALSFPSDRALAHFGLITRPLTSSSSTSSRPRTYSPPSFSSSYSAPPKSEEQQREPERSYGPPQPEVEEESQSYSFPEQEYSGLYPAKTPYQTRKPEPKEDGGRKKNFVHKGRSFAYKFGVQDGDSGNQFAHESQSDGEITTGMYTVQLPDGRLQIVKYSADADTGYQVNVEYQGVPFYPDDKSEEDVTIYKLSPKTTYGVPGQRGNEREEDESNEGTDSDSSSRLSLGRELASSQLSSKRQYSQRRQKSSTSSVSFIREEEKESQSRAPWRANQKPSLSYIPPKTEEKQTEDENSSDEENRQKSPQIRYRSRHSQPNKKAPSSTYGFPTVRVEGKGSEEKEETDEKGISESDKGSKFDDEKNSMRVSTNSRRTYQVPQKINPKENSEVSEGSSSGEQERKYASQINEDSSADRFSSYKFPYIPPSKTHETVALEVSGKSSQSTLQSARYSQEDPRETQPIYAPPSSTYGVPATIIESSSKTDSKVVDDAELSRSYGAPQEARKDEIKNVYFPPQTIYGVPARDGSDEDTEVQSNIDSSVDSVQQSYSVPVEEEDTSDKEKEISQSIYFSPSITYGAPRIRVDSGGDERSTTSGSVSRTYGLPDENEEDTPLDGSIDTPSRVYGTPVTTQDGSEEAEQLIIKQEEKFKSTNPIDAPPSQTYGVPANEKRTPSKEDEEDETTPQQAPSRTYGVPSGIGDDVRHPESVSFPPSRTYGIPNESDEKESASNVSPSRTYGVPVISGSSGNTNPFYSPPRRTYGVPDRNTDGDDDNDKIPNRTYGVPEVQSEDARNTQPIYSPPSRTYGVPATDDDESEKDSDENNNEDDGKNDAKTETNEQLSRTYGLPRDSKNSRETEPIYAPPSKTYGVPAASPDEASDSRANDNDDGSNGENDSEEAKVFGLPRGYGAQDDLKQDDRSTQPIYAPPSRTYGVPDVSQGEASSSDTEGCDENDSEENSSDEENVDELPSQTYGAPEEGDNFSAVQPLYGPPSRTYGVPEFDVEEAANVKNEDDDGGSSGDDSSDEEEEKDRASTPPSIRYGVPEDTRATQPIYTPPSRTYGVPDDNADDTSSENQKTDDGSDASSDDEIRADEHPLKTYGLPSNDDYDSEAPKPIYAPPSRTYGIPDVNLDDEKAEDTDKNVGDGEEGSNESARTDTYQLPSRTYGAPEGDEQDGRSPAPIYGPPSRTYGVPDVSNDEISISDAEVSDDDDSQNSEEDEDTNSYQPPSRTYGVPENDEEDSRAPAPIYGPPSRTHGVPDVSNDDTSGDDTDESNDDDSKNSEEDEGTNSYQSPSRTYGVPENDEEDSRAPAPIYGPPSRTYGVPDVSNDDTSGDDTDESNDDDSKNSEEDEDTNSYQPPSRTYGVPENDEEDSRAPAPIYGPPSRTYGVPDVSNDDTSGDDTDESNDDDSKNSEEDEDTNSYQPLSRTYGVPENDEEDSRAPAPIYGPPSRTYGVPDVSNDDTSGDDTDESNDDDSKNSEEDEDSRAPAPIYGPPSRTYGVPDVGNDDTSGDDTDESNDDDSKNSEEDEDTNSYQPPSRTYGVPENDEEDSRAPAPIYGPPSRTYGVPDVSNDDTGADDTDESNDDDRKNSEEDEDTNSYQQPSRTYGVPENDEEDSRAPPPIYGPPSRTYGVPDVSNDDTGVDDADESNDDDRKNSEEDKHTNLYQQPSRTYGVPENDEEDSRAPAPIYGPPSQTYGVPEVPEVTEDEIRYDDAPADDEEGRGKNEGIKAYEPPSRTYGVPASDEKDIRQPEPLDVPPRWTYGVPDINTDETSVDTADESFERENSNDNERTNTYRAPSRSYGGPEEVSEDSRAPEPIYAPPSRTYGVPYLGLGETSVTDTDETDDNRQNSDKDEETNSYQPPPRTYGVPQDDEDSGAPSPIYGPPGRTYGARNINEDETSGNDASESDDEEDSNKNVEVNVHQLPSRTYGVPGSDGEDAEQLEPLYAAPQRTYGVPDDITDKNNDDVAIAGDDNEDKKNGEASEGTNTYQQPSQTYGVPKEDGEDSGVSQSVYLPPRRTYGVPYVSADDASVDVLDQSGDDDEEESDESENMNTQRSPATAYEVPDEGEDSRTTQPIYTPPSTTYGVPSSGAVETKLEANHSNGDEGNNSEEEDTNGAYKPPGLSYGVPVDDYEDSRGTNPIYSPPRTTYGVPDINEDDTKDQNDDSNDNHRNDSDEDEEIDGYEPPTLTYGVPEDDSDVTALKPIYGPPRRTYGVPEESVNSESNGGKDNNKDGDNTSKDIETNIQNELPSRTYGLPEGRQELQSSYAPPSRTYGTPVSNSFNLKSFNVNSNSLKSSYSSPPESKSSEYESLHAPPSRSYISPLAGSDKVSLSSYSVPPAPTSSEYEPLYAPPSTQNSSTEGSEEAVKSSYSAPPSPTSSEYEPLYAPPSTQYSTPTEDSGEVKSSYSAPPSPTSSEYEPLYAPPSTQYSTPTEDSGEVRSSYSVPPAPTSSEYEPLNAPLSKQYIAPSDDSNERVQSSYSAPPAPESGSDADAQYEPLYAPPSRAYGTPEKKDSEKTIPEKIRTVRLRSPLRRLNTSRRKPTVYYHPKPLKVLPFNSYRSKSRHTREPDELLVSSRPTRYETHSKHSYSS